MSSLLNTTTELGLGSALSELGFGAANAGPQPSAAVVGSGAFPPPPPEPESLEQAGLTDSDVEALVLKTLIQSGNCSGAQIGEQICLPRVLVSDILNRLRDELLIGIKSSVGMNDYLYQITEAGFQRGRQYLAQCNYSGAAPVPVAAYERAVRGQSIQQTPMRLKQLSDSLADLTFRPEFISQIAQAINDGRGMFLFGPPGNGKTTIAERLCDAFGQYIWIPRMIGVGGDLIRLYDASCHELADAPQLATMRYDRRWVLVRRPTVVVGGELQLDQLDARYVEAAGITEAPVQLKANGGALVIDDFGRQRASSTEILNRLIVPLEKQFDFLNLASGRQVQTPFDMLFVLSTNLEPKQLVDEAFLRRIPYKIEVNSPRRDEFEKLFEHTAGKLGYQLEPGVTAHLIDTHYQGDREMRFCHPRDLLRQVKNFCEVHELPAVVTQQGIDQAVQNYFAGL